MLDVPTSFRAMPRWWDPSPQDSEWLDDLPHLVEAQCRQWNLTIDGTPVHGSNALVVPVLRGGRPAALRLAPLSDDVGALSAALRFWRGHCMVEELAADPAAGALLLERLDPHSPLTRQPLDVAIPEIGRIARRLAIPLDSPTHDAIRTDHVPAVGHTSDDVATQTAQLRPAWERLGRPFDGAFLDVAADAAEVVLTGDRAAVAVNTDLHFDQVLRHPDGGWRVVDPVLRRGDAERTAVNVLWHRVDEMTDPEIPTWFDVLVQAAELDPGLARAWALWRITDYLVWGLEHGLTEDPPRCVRLLRALA